MSAFAILLSLDLYYKQSFVNIRFHIFWKILKSKNLLRLGFMYLVDFLPEHDQ
jgi:hypothetical protein